MCRFSGAQQLHQRYRDRAHREGQGEGTRAAAGADRNDPISSVINLYLLKFILRGHKAKKKH